ncbi:hypothetical protein [Thalassobellus suaedae]|uniref:Oligosaccharide repeat unit polymerase n=1 Tax=Thalassobellus suaedae TaxID=3074124 RepID=A0ABY9Y7B7_9FLAO|nr:hypothetical protein RHP49_06870 [Flavobacteriaceae bacterium HL-DH10]
MLKFFKNPFYIYLVSFGLVFLLYLLGWSSAFPKLSFGAYAFFSLTFILYLIFGLITEKASIIGYKKIVIKKGFTIKKGLIVVFFVLGIEILFEGNSPLFYLLFGGKEIDYKDFGIKVIHVFFVSFTSFLIVYSFHTLISNKGRKNLVYFILTLLPGIIILNRGMIMIGLFSCFFVFILSLNYMIKLKQILLLVMIFLGVLYVFGYLGNLRSANGDSNYIPLKSGATESFMDSPIPKEFYWTYLYGASPVANFQNTINKTETVDYNIISLIVQECLPDFISKRIVSVFNMEEKQIIRIRDWLTVGGVYSKSYAHAKWIGPIILSFYGVFFLLIMMMLVPKRSNFHVTQIAILLAMMFFNTFSNMFVFSGIVLQLVYPIFFRFFENKRIVLK